MGHLIDYAFLISSDIDLNILLIVNDANGAFLESKNASPLTEWEGLIGVYSISDET